MFMLVSCVGEYNTIRYDTLGVTQDYYHGEWRTLNSSNVSSSVAFDRPRRGSSCRTLQKEEQRKYVMRPCRVAQVPWTNQPMLPMLPCTRGAHNKVSPSQYALVLRKYAVRRTGIKNS